MPYWERGDEFTDRLGIVFTIYASAVTACFFLLLILDQVGVSGVLTGYLLIFFTLGSYAVIGVLSRTVRPRDFITADRRVPPVYSGIATASSLLGGGGFVVLAGWIYASAYDGLALILGWAAGLALLGVLLAPFLRKHGAATVPDFLASRFGGVPARLLASVTILVSAGLLLAVQFTLAHTIATRYLGLEGPVVVLLMAGAILVCSLLGGMRSVIWTQVAQYLVLAAAFLIPLAILSTGVTGLPIPHIAYGQELQALARLEAGLVGQGLAAPGSITAFVSTDPVNMIALILCIAAGTAVMPHILPHALTISSAHEARRSMAWALVFTAVVLLAAPAYAAFVKHQIYQTVTGAAFTDLPDWVFRFAGMDWPGRAASGLINICGAPAMSPEAAARACQAIGHGLGAAGPAHLEIHPALVVLAAPHIGKMPAIFASLLAAGAIAAALSTVNALLIAVANTLGHDIFHRILAPRASISRRLLVSRLVLVASAGAGAYFSAGRTVDIYSWLTWSFSIAAAGLFPAAVLGIWWKRCTALGAVTGMAAGLTVTGLYILGTGFLGWPLIFGIENVSAAVFGIPAGLAVIIAVSLAGKAPSRDIQRMVDKIRIPVGETVVEEQRHELAHPEPAG